MIKKSSILGELGSFLRFTRGSRMMTLCGIACVTITSTIDSIATVHYLPEMISFFAQGYGFTTKILLMMLGVVVVRCLSGYLGIVLLYNAGQRILLQIRCSMFDKMGVMKTTDRLKFSSAELNSMMTYNCEQILRAVSFSVRTGLQHSVFMLQSAVYLMLKSGVLFVITLGFLPLMVYSYRYFGQKCRKTSADTAQFIGGLSRYSDRAFNSMDTLKVNQSLPYVRDNFFARSMNVYKAAKRYTHNSAMLHVVAQFLIFIPILFIFTLARVGVVVINEKLCLHFYWH